MLHRSAPAKINLGLHVLRKRADGFHDVETVFIRIPWADVVHVEAAEDIRVMCSDRALPCDEANLVMRAARLLAKTYGARAGASIHLEKHLPVGAGLGGGSSDAAATLKLLNAHWELHATSRELAALAAQLGSDVPFFLGPEAAFGTGRGEILEPLIDAETREAYRPPYPLVVAVPAVGVSTPEAYGMVAPSAQNRPALRELVLSNDLERWRRELVNDFEVPIFERYPAIREVRQALLESGASYASMSGSGSAVFGFFEDDLAASGAAEALRATGHRVWHGRV